MVEKMMCEEMCDILIADTSTLASDEAIEGGVENSGQFNYHCSVWPLLEAD